MDRFLEMGLRGYKSKAASPVRPLSLTSPEKTAQVRRAMGLNKIPEPAGVESKEE